MAYMSNGVRGGRSRAYMALDGVLSGRYHHHMGHETSLLDQVARSQPDPWWLKAFMWLVVAIISAAVDLVFAFTGMIWLGIAHGFDERVPAFGYWTVYFLIWTAGAVTASVRVGIKLGDYWQEQSR